MNEKEALRWLESRMPVGDDCYVLEQPDTNLLLSTDMLHRKTDFPAGTTPYTMGWRSVAVSLSDIAGMGGTPFAVLIAYGAPDFDKTELEEFLSGAEEVCSLSGGKIVGGDLDHHKELTITTSVLGKADHPVLRSGANPGDLVAVTGDLGRTGAALKLFAKGEIDLANQLFQFEPRIEEGKRLAKFSTSMMDISDGLARSLHQIAESSNVGFRIAENQLPYAPAIDKLVDAAEEKRELALFTGEDFELLATIPPEHEFELAKLGVKTIGKVTAPEGVKMVIGSKVIELEDRGYVH